MLEHRTSEREHQIVLGLFFLAAALLHVAAGIALGMLEPTGALAVAPETLPPVEFIPIEPEPEPEPMDDAPPEPVAAPEPPPPEPEPEPVRRARPAPLAAREDPAPAPAEEQVLDLSGMTLSGGTSSFAVAAGNGEESDRIGRPGVVATGRRREGVPGGVIGGTGTTTGPVPVADLRRRPEPPGNLEAILERRYPREARQLGIEGTATVRIVFLADGRPASVRVTNESVQGQGFGAACRAALQEAGNWSAPVGRDGQPAATSMPFRCRFDIR